MKERIEYIDVIETLAIFLVVWCHRITSLGVGYVTNITLQFSTTIAVPLFFMANGCLLLNEKINLKKHLKKTLMLAVSVVSWKLLLLGLCWAENPNSFAGINKVLIFNYLTGDSNLWDPYYVPAAHFWFMYALIGIYLLYPLIKLAYDNNKKIYHYIMILLFLFVFVHTDINESLKIIETKRSLPAITFDTFHNSFYPFGAGGSYLLFFMLGPILHEHFYNRKIEKNKKLELLIGIFLGFSILLIEKYFQQGSLNGPWTRLNGDYQRIGTLLMSVCAYALAASIYWAPLNKLNKFFKFISLRTMNIYAIHMWILTEFDYHFFSRFPMSGFVVYLIRTVICIVIALIITEILSWIPIVNKLLGLKNSKKI